MTTALPGLPHLIGLLRSPRGGLAILGAVALSALLVIRALAATLVVSTVTLPDGAQSTAYSQTLTATGGTAPYAWIVTEGALPLGLTLEPNGLIHGSPSVLANSAFTAQVTDGDGNTATKSLAIKVNPTLTITTTTLASGVQSVAYIGQQLAATGGASPYTWAPNAAADVTTLSATGLTLSSGGLIAGTVAALAPASSTFVVKVTDAGGLTDTQSLTIAVSPAGTLTIETTTLPNGIQGAAYPLTTVAVAGGTLPYPATAWSVTTGVLPDGLTLNAATGAITGTLTATAVSQTFTVTITDDAPPATDTQVLTITVNAPVVISPNTLGVEPLPAATAGTPYVTVLAATGGTAPYNWSAPGLPAGLTLFPAAGVISGIPTTAGTTTFTASVTDVNLVADATPQQFSILVGAAPAPVITTNTLPNAIIGSSYTYQLQRTGGLAPFTWSISAGTLPSGLALDTATGIISGTPLAGALSAPTLSFQVGPTPSTSAAKLLPITVVAAGTLNITTTTLPNATINVAYPTQTLARTGGVAPITWTLASGSGPLPTGLTLNTNGTITGTPSVLGPVTFTVQVTDSTPGAAMVDTQVLSITVVAAGAPIITTTTLPNATINIAYSQTLARTGGTGPFTWSTPVATPSWLTLNPTTGQLTGTPLAVAAAASFTVLVTDTATGLTDDQVLSITVGATPPVGTAGTGNFYGPCKAFYRGSEMGQAQKSHATAFRRLIDAAGVTAQVQAFCDANGQPESNEDQEFRRLCTSFFSGSNSWRYGGSKTSGLRRLIEAAGTADAVRNFCTTNFGAFTGQECDDDDLHGVVHQANISSRGNNDNHGNNGNKKDKH